MSVLEDVVLATLGSLARHMGRCLCDNLSHPCKVLILLIYFSEGMELNGALRAILVDPDQIAYRSLRTKPRAEMGGVPRTGRFRGSERGALMFECILIIFF
jgi:hypothetical protein